MNFCRVTNRAVENWVVSCVTPTKNRQSAEISRWDPTPSSSFRTYGNIVLTANRGAICFSRFHSILIMPSRRLNNCCIRNHLLANCFFFAAADVVVVCWGVCSRRWSTATDGWWMDGNTRAENKNSFLVPSAVQFFNQNTTLPIPAKPWCIKYQPVAEGCWVVYRVMRITHYWRPWIEFVVSHY